VEVLFPKYGWLMFEPTPTRRNPATASFDFPVTFIRPPPGSTDCSTLAEPPFGNECTQAGDRSNPVPRGGRRGEEPPPSGQGGGIGLPHPVSWRTRAFEIGLLALLLLLLAIPAVKAVRRRGMMKRARAPGQRVLAAYERLAAQAADIGLGRGEAETLWEYRSRLRDRVPGLDGRFDRLTGLAGRAAYSQRGISDEQVTEALATVRQSWRLIRRSTSIGRRILGVFWVQRSALFPWAAA
jgi:uncharacterized protein DUF4129